MPVAEKIPVAQPADAASYQAAAQLLEKAIQGGPNDPNMLYMLALACKRQGKLADARAALRKVNRPDAAVFLQMGLLSLRENQPEQAEQELTRAWGLDSTSFAIGYNLFLARLYLGQLESAGQVLPHLIPLASTYEQKRFVTILHGLLHVTALAGKSLPSPETDALLRDFTPAEEQRLLKLLRSLGQIDVIHPLLQTLAGIRTTSRAIQDAYFDAALLKARELMARARWTEAEVLLDPLTRARAAGRAHQVAAFNLLGCCCYLTQDFEKAARQFAAAVKLSSNDARLSQNLALSYEMQGQLSQADAPWNRFFELLESATITAPEDVPHYQSLLLFESLCRLANSYSEKEKWPTALTYLQRAHKLQPHDADVLERLFHVYNHAKRPDNARKALEKLRELRPDDPQLDLYELDLVEVKKLDDIERLLTEIDRIRKRHPDDHRVEERAVNMVGNVVPLMGNLCDQLTDQLTKVIEQVRNLPRYQIDWSALREILRDLSKEFQKLRRITGKCLPLVTRDEHKRIVRELAEHIDQKIELCRNMQN